MSETVQDRHNVKLEIFACPLFPKFRDLSKFAKIFERWSVC